MQKANSADQDDINALTMLVSLISEAGGQIPETLATMYPSESGKLELHFEDEIQRIRTPQGQYLWDASIRRPNHKTFMHLLDQSFHLETLRERLDGSSLEGRIASCLGPIVAISLKTSTDTEINDDAIRHLCSRCGMVTRNPGEFCSVCQKYLDREKPAPIPELIFVGTDVQLAAMEAICVELQLPIIRYTDPEIERDFVGFLRTDKPSFVIALRHIFAQRADGWWLQQHALSEHKICTDAQFEAAYHDGLSKL